MKAYSEYKAMNLPWLKAIPAHWEIRRNKNVFTEMKEEVGEHSSEYTLLSLTLKRKSSDKRIVFPFFIYIVSI